MKNPALKPHVTMNPRGYWSVSHAPKPSKLLAYDHYLPWSKTHDHVRGMNDRKQTRERIARKPRITFRSGGWYCHGPKEPSGRIVGAWGEASPRAARLQYVMRCGYSLGLPAEVAA